MALSLQADLTLINGALRPDVTVHVGGDGRIIGVDRPGDETEDEAEGNVVEIFSATSGEFAAPQGRKIHRLRKRVLLPGFVNAHSHAFQRLLRGRTEFRAPGRPGDDFWSWRNAMYKVTQALDPDELEAVTRMAMMEMLLAGYTHVVEFHYLHNQKNGQQYDDPAELSRRVLAAAESAGIGITLLRVAYQRGGVGIAASVEQRRFTDPDLDRYARAWEATVPLVELGSRRPVQIGMAAHSVRALDKDFLEGLGRLAEEKGCVLHAHVAEQPREVEECLQEHDCRPLELLAASGLVTERFTAVHGTYLAAEEADLLGEAGATVCICPTTERNLGDGLPDLQALQSAGARLAIGSDSQVRINPFAELRGLEDGERLRLGRRNCLAPAAGGPVAPYLLEAGSAGGARAGQLGAGSIAPGQRADLVAVDLEVPMLAGVLEGRESDGALLAALVLGGDSSWVCDVWVGGRHVVEAGQLLRWPSAVEDYRKVAKRVWG